MDTQSPLEEYLLQSGAFSEKDPPVLGTSGLPLFYFMNSERLLNDDNLWQNYSNSSVEMIAHSLKAWKNSPYRQTIDELVCRISPFLQGRTESLAISGYQRRDWIFSGALAQRLGLPHYSIYKDGTWEKVLFEGDEARAVAADDLKDTRLVHISDLITTGSSALKGWLPEIRKHRLELLCFFNVVSRNQGGEENMQRAGVRCESLFHLGEEFLRRNTKNSARALAYFHNPEQSAISFLQEHGALCFLDHFDPAGSKLPRALSLLKNWGKVLNAEQHKALVAAVQQAYGYNLADLIE